MNHCLVYNSQGGRYLGPCRREARGSLFSSIQLASQSTRSFTSSQNSRGIDHESAWQQFTSILCTLQPGQDLGYLGR
jgi:hypothetical protein